MHASGIIDYIHCSTDSPTIGALAEEYGAHCHWLRSAENASDTADIEDVVTEEVTRFHKLGEHPGIVVLCYATSVFVTPEDIRWAVERVRAGARAVMGIAAFGRPVQRALIRKPEGGVRFAFAEYEHSSTNTLPRYYYDPGQVYAFRPRAFLDAWAAGVSLIGMMEDTRELTLVWDIDEPRDWEIAEGLWRQRHGA
jgi:CMP-N-acetylneuraminic acid synthetase